MPGERVPLNLQYGAIQGPAEYDRVAITFTTRPGLDAFDALPDADKHAAAVFCDG